MALSLFEASEHEEAAWCKLTGKRRTACAWWVNWRAILNAATVTGNTMRAACDLARWFGNEATRIYAELAETREQREQGGFARRSNWRGWCSG